MTKSRAYTAKSGQNIFSSVGMTKCRAFAYKYCQNISSSVAMTKSRAGQKISTSVGLTKIRAFDTNYKGFINLELILDYFPIIFQLFYFFQNCVFS